MYKSVYLSTCPWFYIALSKYNSKFIDDIALAIFFKLFQYFHFIFNLKILIQILAIELPALLHRKKVMKIIISLFIHFIYLRFYHLKKCILNLNRFCLIP